MTPSTSRKRLNLKEPAMRMRRTHAEAGFAWTDLVVLVLILGMLSAIAIPIYISVDQQAHSFKTVEADVLATKNNVRVAIAQDKTIHSGSTFEEVGAPVQNSRAVPKERISVLIQSEHEILILGTIGESSRSWSQTVRH
jgi:Tfp pilus assembly major pilin PilA